MVEPILKTVHSVTEGSRLSKVICEYCGTIYAAEKGRMPHLRQSLFAGKYQAM